MVKPETSQKQIDRFKEAACELDCDEDEAAFKAKLAVIARQKPKGKSSGRERKRLNA